MESFNGNFFYSVLISVPVLHGSRRMSEGFDGSFLYNVLTLVTALRGGGHIAEGFVGNFLCSFLILAPRCMVAGWKDFAESLWRFKAYGHKTLKSQPFKRKACENQLEKSGCTVWA